MLVIDRLIGLASAEAALRRAVRLEARGKAAAALGRLGGKKGGKARATALSPERRAEIAREAAKARWKK